MKRSIYTLAAAGLFLLSNQLQAQTAKSDTILNRELTLEKEYNPSIRDAVKINQIPEVREPEAPKAQVEFANYATPYDIQPNLYLLKANSYFSNLNPSAKRGYLNAGVSSFVDINGDLGYQILNNHNDQLSLFGSHRSSNGNIKYIQDDEKQKMKINDNLFGLNYLHNFGNSRLTINANYFYSAFNYYGFTFPEAFERAVIDPTFIVVDKDQNQVDQILQVSAGLEGGNEETFNYDIKAGYALYKQKYFFDHQTSGPNENSFFVDLDLNKNLDSDKRIGVRLGYEGNSYSKVKMNSTSVIDYEFENSGDLALNPYFRYDGGNWSLRLGVLVDILSGDSKDLNVAPDLELSVYPLEKLNVYMNVKGGVVNNSMKNIYGENRYVAPNVRVENSFSSFDATVGLKSSVGNFWYDLFAGFRNFSDEHFYQQSFLYNEDYMQGDLLGGNYSNPDYSDGYVFRLGADLKYKLSGAFDLGLKATYYNWSLKDTEVDGGPNIENYAFNKPNFEADLTATYQFPTLPLRLSAIYHLETGREAGFKTYLEDLYYINKSAATAPMDNINDLKLRGTYTINNTLSVFAQANNLLFQKYDIWYGYPAENFSFMAGINIKF